MNVRVYKITGDPFTLCLSVSDKETRTTIPDRTRWTRETLEHGHPTSDRRNETDRRQEGVRGREQTSTRESGSRRGDPGWR